MVLIGGCDPPDMLSGVGRFKKTVSPPPENFRKIRINIKLSWTFVEGYSMIFRCLSRDSFGESLGDSVELVLFRIPRISLDFSSDTQESLDPLELTTVQPRIVQEFEKVHIFRSNIFFPRNTTSFVKKLTYFQEINVNQRNYDSGINIFYFLLNLHLQKAYLYHFK